ncbi:hypothetical protein, partial [Rhizobium sp. LjRoot30]|uniref:hypothetical protein n=1 Tax=Rhizobium sp. LjRoot30 TaxID=3342320 RepID=UPI003F50208F
NITLFFADLWEMMPTYKGSRYLAPIDQSLGYTPGNVEIRYGGFRRRAGEKIQTRKMKRMAENTRVADKPKKRTASERKAAEMEARVARRQKLAAEFQRWEEQRARRR